MGRGGGEMEKWRSEGGMVGNGGGGGVDLWLVYYTLHTLFTYIFVQGTWIMLLFTFDGMQVPVGLIIL